MIRYYILCEVLYGLASKWLNVAFHADSPYESTDHFDNVNIQKRNIG
jgi:hypothetical protein